MAFLRLVRFPVSGDGGFCMLFRALSIPAILILLPVLGYFAICVMLFFRQERMIFFPTVHLDDEFDEAANTSGFKPWRDEQGNRIGWKRVQPDAERVILACHGNGGSAVNRFELSAILSSGPVIDLYLLEYPGYGSRPGRPSEKSLVAAAVEAIDWLRGPSGSPDLPIWLLGESLGTGVASAAAAARPDAVTGLILVTPFDSLVGAAQCHYPWLPVGGLMRHRFDSVKNLSRFHGPVAIVIAGDDLTTPPKLGQRLAASLSASNRVWLIPGAGHNDTTALLQEWPEMTQWLETSGAATKVH